MTLDAFLALLDGVRRSGTGYVAKCPAHDDRSASLSVGEGADGRILVNCFAGCATEAVVAARGLEMKDLMPESTKASASRPAQKIVATYDYTDEAGALLFQVVRYEPKGFRQRMPDGSGGWTWNLAGVRRVLYRLPELQAADPARLVYLAEGEKDSDRLAALGLLATTNVGGAANWKPDQSEPLRGRPVVILLDNDEQGRKRGRELPPMLHGTAASVRVLDLPGLPEKGDVSDWLDAGGTAPELERLAFETTTWGPEPPPDLAALLDDLVVFVRRFVVLTSTEARIAALFVVHTHAIEAAEATPFLIVRSPERECGKTRLLEVLEMLVRQPLRAASLSAAALYSSVQEEKPTLLLDEMDGVFFDPKKQNDNDDLRRLLNAGNRRGSLVIRCAWEQGKRIREKFETFCPRILAGIGRLPETIESRSFIFRLRRRTKGEEIERFGPRERRRIVPRAGELARSVETWATANLDRLKEADPDFPKGLKDREEEGAQPLLAIADLAGPEWGERARLAVAEIVGRTSENEDSFGVRLLRDCRDVFASRAEDRVSSADLVSALVAIEESPWGEAHHGKPLTVRELARLLNPYGVLSGTIRLPDGKTPKGYYRASFDDAIARYVEGPTHTHPQEGVQYATTPQHNAGAGFLGENCGGKTGVADKWRHNHREPRSRCGDHGTATPRGTPQENPEFVNVDGPCDVVADTTPSGEGVSPSPNVEIL